MAGDDTPGQFVCLQQAAEHKQGRRIEGRLPIQADPNKCASSLAVISRVLNASTPSSSRSETGRVV